MQVGEVYYDVSEEVFVTIEKIENNTIYFSGYENFRYITSNGLVAFDILSIEILLSLDGLILQDNTHEQELNEILKQNGIDYKAIN